MGKPSKFATMDEHDWLVCECGNEPHLSGFSPCLTDGTYNDYEPEWDEHYLCDECGHIFHLRGRQVGVPIPSVGWVDFTKEVVRRG